MIKTIPEKYLPAEEEQPKKIKFGFPESEYDKTVEEIEIAVTAGYEKYLFTLKDDGKFNVDNMMVIVNELIDEKIKNVEGYKEIAHAHLCRIVYGSLKEVPAAMIKLEAFLGKRVVIIEGDDGDGKMFSFDFIDYGDNDDSNKGSSGVQATT